MYKLRITLCSLSLLILVFVVFVALNWPVISLTDVNGSRKKETLKKVVDVETSPSNGTEKRPKVTERPSTPHRKQPKKILYWGYYSFHEWRESWPMGELACSHDVSCILTDNASEYTSSDAVILHSAKGSRLEGLPSAARRPPNQVWVFLTMESPLYAGSFYKNKSIINFTMTYLLRSDFHQRYGDIEHQGTYQGGFNSSKNYLERKNKSVAAIVSNCGQKRRLEHIRALAKWIDVDVFGRCGDKQLCRGCWDQLQPYKFYLAYENNICVDYVTEKLYNNGLSHGMVPVVLGGANYSNPLLAPPGSYIDARNFTSAKELASFLAVVGSDPNLYREYFRWHTGYRVRMRSYEERLCKLCEVLHQNGSFKVYEDVMDWYRTVGHCDPYPPVH